MMKFAKGRGTVGTLVLPAFNVQDVLLRHEIFNKDGNDLYGWIVN